MPTLQELSPGQALPERTHSASAVSLFLYNAAVWNPHRIHYDAAYTTEIEHHPGIVIDGPLQGDWLSQAALNWAGEDAVLESFSYSNRRAAYLGETLTSGGQIRSIDPVGKRVTLDLFIRNEAGDVISPGAAVLRLLR